MAHQTTAPSGRLHEDRPQSTAKSQTRAKDTEDKSLDELVLSDLYYEIARNLPPDDVLTYMHQEDLVTDGQRDQYRMMKANNYPEVERSEYLLECLRKGKPGFLDRFCNILRNIPPASYIADKIKGKKVQLAQQQQSAFKSQNRTDRTKKLKGDSHWMLEYKKLEQKTRMQLQAKDREIKRLRNAIRELENESNNNLKSLLSEMKCQVEILSKLIDNKSEVHSKCSALVKLALSHDGKLDDIFTGTSESSSNQSTMERPSRPRRKEQCTSHSQQNFDSSTKPDQINSSAEQVIISSLQGCSDSAVFQHFTANISNPQTAVESDTSDTTRPLQVTEFTASLSPEPDVGKNEKYPTKLVLQDHTDGHDKEHNDAMTVLNSKSSRSTSVVYVMPEPTPRRLTNLCEEEAATATCEEPQTPSTVKSYTTSPTPPAQCSSQAKRGAKIFRYGKELSSQPRHQNQESVSDFRAVFRKIRGKDPPTK